MSSKTLSIVIIVLILIGLGLGGHFWVKNSDKFNNTNVDQPTITSLTVAKPNLVVHGKNLSKVEIYAVPSGTEISETESILLGEAKPSLGGNGDNIWTLPIPADPILATEIYAVGYDKDNNKVDQVSLNLTGTTAIYNALWSEAKTILLQLKVGQTGTFENLSLTLNQVTADSRCAIDVVCIQAGDVTLETRLIYNKVEDSVVIHQNDDAYSFGDFFIDVIEVLPAPVSETKINPNDYLVTFSVAKNIKP